MKGMQTVHAVCMLFPLSFLTPLTVSFSWFASSLIHSCRVNAGHEEGAVRGAVVGADCGGAAEAAAGGGCCLRPLRRCGLESGDFARTGDIRRARQVEGCGRRWLHCAARAGLPPACCLSGSCCGGKPVDAWQRRWPTAGWACSACRWRGHPGHSMLGGVQLPCWAGHSYRADACFLVCYGRVPGCPICSPCGGAEPGQCAHIALGHPLLMPLLARAAHCPGCS